MNLALYIYLADLVGNLKFTFQFFTWTSGAATIALLIGIFIHQDFDEYKHGKELEDAISKRSKIWTFVKAASVVLISSSLLTVPLPSKGTMYAMAAAYYGEQAVKSETFQRLNSKAMKLLEVKIDELVGEAKK